MNSRAPGACQEQWGLLLERLRRLKTAVAYILCVPHGTSRQIPVLMSRREGRGLGQLCSCSPEGCVRLCLLSVSTCVAGWVCSVSAAVRSGCSASLLPALREREQQQPHIHGTDRRTAPGSHCPSGPAACNAD